MLTEDSNVMMFKRHLNDSKEYSKVVTKHVKRYNIEKLFKTQADNTSELANNTLKECFPY